MLRFTSKCSLLLLAVMPRWAYADLTCKKGVLISEDMNRVFEEFFLAPYNFDNAGFVSQTGLQFQANSEASCEAAAAKINDHADYSGAPTIECYDWVLYYSGGADDCAKGAERINTIIATHTDGDTSYLDAQTVTIHSLDNRQNPNNKNKMQSISLAEITAIDDARTVIDPITATFASDDSSAQRLPAANCVDGDGDTICHSKGSNPTLTITYPAGRVIRRVTVQNHMLWGRSIKGATLTIRNAKGTVVSIGPFCTSGAPSESYEFFNPPHKAADCAASLTAGDDDGDDIAVPGALDEIDEIELAAAPPPTNADLATTNLNLKISLAVVSTLLAVSILHTLHQSTVSTRAAGQAAQGKPAAAADDANGDGVGPKAYENNGDGGVPKSFSSITEI